MTRSSALNVHYRTSKLLQSGLITRAPVWYRTVLERPPQTTYTENVLRKRIKPLKYKADKLRDRFYREHPWDLARPRVVAENDASELDELDWSTLDQPTRTLSGENVVQHQLWLMQNENLSENEAYIKAVSEFYRLRAKQETLIRVARDEALAFGAVFEISPLEKTINEEERFVKKWRENAVSIASARVDPLDELEPPKNFKSFMKLVGDSSDENSSDIDVSNVATS